MCWAPRSFTSGGDTQLMGVACLEPWDLKLQHALLKQGLSLGLRERHLKAGNPRFKRGR